ncbi:acetyl-CoA synthetase-like protein [Irpex lacteus]|nr:acetyl-CoA synthetase-like protein [Irpex lacteus]
MSRWPDSPLIRPFTGTETEYSWGLITFGEFRRDLEKTAEYYQKTLFSAGLKAGDVVGLWLTGEHVTDLVHLYGLARAGYVPELFSLKFSLPGQAVALVYDAHFHDIVNEITCPTLPDASDALQPLPDVSAEDPAIIFHTSGTTGGRPKPVPQSHKWCIAHAKYCWNGAWQGKYDTQDVVNNIGSFAHMGASTYIYKSAFTGAAFVQTSHAAIGADEFLAMVKQCGLNRLLQYATWLSALIDVARTNDEVLSALQGMRQVMYTGLAMNPEDEAWAYAHGIPLTNMYGTTETVYGSVRGAKENYLRPIPELGLELIPALNDKSSGSDASQKQLYDLFLPLTALNCPCPKVRNRPDGHITGDLFEEVNLDTTMLTWMSIPGGRSDDWIKTGPTRAAFCDTKAIEDNVLKTCADLVRNCVAVGHLKPRVVLLLESSASSGEIGTDEAQKLKEEVLRRTAEFNSRLLEHERITDPASILVVPAGSLPRTSEKGNIR